MVESESTFSYMRATQAYIEQHGKPVAFYSDKHSAFRNNRATANGDGMSHLGRALETLNIELIEEANAFLPSYMARHNERFARAPFDPRDLHRRLARHDNL